MASIESKHRESGGEPEGLRAIAIFDCPPERRAQVALPLLNLSQQAFTRLPRRVRPVVRRAHQRPCSRPVGSLDEGGEKLCVPTMKDIALPRRLQLLERVGTNGLQHPKPPFAVWADSALD